MTKITNRIYILLISFASAMVALVFNLIVPLFGHRLVYSACVCVWWRRRVLSTFSHLVLLE